MKTVKGGEFITAALEREMPDDQIVEKVKQSGVNLAMKDYKPPKGTTIVRTQEDAKRVVEILRSHGNRIHAWDTETIGIDVKAETPVGHGTVLCAQCFIGPDVDFGNGPRLFIDNYADAHNVILEFKEYFEDERFLKCWHNYSFDRHILFNHGIDVKGFGGDTMHMARLADPSRMRYSLKELTREMEPEILQCKHALLQHKTEEVVHNLQKDK